ITIPPNASNISIGQDGTMTANLPGQVDPVQLGQIQLATFMNPGGLQSMGQNLYLETAASGLPALNEPGTNGAGLLNHQYVETSNVNVVEELVSMIQAQRA